MNRSLMMTANNTRARYFSGSRQHADWQEIADLVAPESRLTDQAFNSDRSGSAHGGGLRSRHGLESEKGRREVTTERFAKLAATELAKRFEADNYDHIVLCAAPAFLGKLRAVLPKSCRRCIEMEIDKDLTLHSVDELASALAKHRDQIPKG